MNDEKITAAWRRFDEENARDPNQVLQDGRLFPRELVYAGWLTGWVLRLRPDASAALRLAARCQHLCRWMIPRSSYPQTRAGYLKWREDLKMFHARKAGEILGEAGFAPEIIERVQSLNLKRNLTTDPEVQVLEDALCLVFLEHQLAELADKTSEDKVLTALKKSWAKMSPAGRAEALRLRLPARERALVEKALVV
jgi:hypothetical protein